MVVPERKHYDDVLSLEQLLTIKYSFESSLGASENYRYKQSVIGSVMLQDEQGNDLEEIGRIYLDKLLFGVGMNSGWGHFEIFDTEQYIMDMGACVWDFKNGWYNKTLDKFFGHELTETDILYMHTVEVLPEWRGMQIGEHVMKDAANNFEQGCSLIVTDCRPIQHVFWGKEDAVWHEKMKYKDFEHGKRKAKQKVINYLKRTGFYYLPNVSKDHMFLCPAQRNPNFDYIELE